MIKVDFEKAYDKIKWPFVYQMLKLKGFSDAWCDLVMKTITGGKVGIKVNNSIGSYFFTHQGLRQGDPLSPLLFDLTVDGLAMMMDKAKKCGLIKGLVPELVDNGLVLLQYADDTIFFLEDDVSSAQNLKFLLCIFEQISGLKINFDKSVLFCFGDAIKKKEQYELIFSCSTGMLPIKYLGLPVDQKQLLNKDWSRVEENMEGGLSCWQGKLMPIGGG
jgi:hypothetical protein